MHSYYRALDVFISRVALGSVLILNISASPSKTTELANGFFMYCTSNSDGTGACVNEEDGRDFTCIIVPGQIITCPAKKQSTVDCVWISSVTAEQAQFWCDKEDEENMYFTSANSSGDFGSTINNNEFNGQSGGDLKGILRDPDF